MKIFMVAYNNKSNNPFYDEEIYAGAGISVKKNIIIQPKVEIIQTKIPNVFFIKDDTDILTEDYIKELYKTAINKDSGLSLQLDNGYDLYVKQVENYFSCFPSVSNK